MALPRLGVERFVRGAPEPRLVVAARSTRFRLYDLLKA